MAEPTTLEMIDQLRVEYQYLVMRLKSMANSPLSSEVDRQLAQQTLLEYADLGKEIDDLAWFYGDKEKSNG